MQKLSAILLLVSFASARAQSAIQFQFHFSDIPGPYAVGVKVEHFDQSRHTLKEPQLPIFMWYPAESSDSKTVTLGDYESMLHGELIGSTAQDNRWSSVDTYMRGTTGIHTWALRDAKPIQEHFPVVIYAPSLNAPSIENIELCEYLASQGFVVLAISSHGVDSAAMSVDLKGANIQASDISNLIDFSETLSNADSSRSAAVGYSWGAMGALFAANRDRRIKALIALDGSFRYSPGIVASADIVHPEQMTIPLLFFSRAEEPLETWDATRKNEDRCDCAPNVLNAWTHGDLIHIHMLAMSHIQFSSLYQRSQRFREEALKFSPADYSLEEGAEGYSWVARYTAEFLKAYLGNDQKALGFLGLAPAKNGVHQHQIWIETRRAKPQSK